MKILKFISVASISLFMLMILLCLNLLMFARFTLLSEQFVNKKMDELQHAFMIENKGTFSYLLEERKITIKLSDVLDTNELEWINNEFVESRREIISFMLGERETLPTVSLAPLKTMIPKLVKTALFKEMDLTDGLETFKEMVQTDILQSDILQADILQSDILQDDILQAPINGVDRIEKKDIESPSDNNKSLLDEERLFSNNDVFFSQEFIAFTLDKKDALASGEFSYEELLIEFLNDSMVNKALNVQYLQDTIDLNQLYAHIQQTTTDPIEAIQTFSQSITNSILQLSLLVVLCGLLLFFIMNKVSFPLYMIASQILIISVCTIALNTMFFILMKNLTVNPVQSINNQLTEPLMNNLLYFILLHLIFGVILPIIAMICIHAVKAHYVKRKSSAPLNDLEPKTFHLPTSIRWIASLVVCAGVYLILSGQFQTYKTVFNDVRQSFSNFDYSFEKSDVLYKDKATQEPS